MPWPQDDRAPVSLESLDKKLDKIVKQLIAPEALSEPLPATSGRRATNAGDACLNAMAGIDYDGYAHRWSGQHAGSLEDFYLHLKNNKIEYPNLDFSPGDVGKPNYADWKDPYLALCLLAANDLKTPAEISILGFYGTVYQERIKNEGWKTTTVDEWLTKLRSTNGQGGASGDSA